MRTLSSNQRICPLCTDVYEMMSDEGHTCRLTAAERRLLDTIAIYEGTMGQKGPRADAAQAYLREREPHRNVVEMCGERHPQKPEIFCTGAKGHIYEEHHFGWEKTP